MAFSDTSRYLCSASAHFIKVRAGVSTSSHRIASHPVCLCNNVLAAHRVVACRYGTCDKPRSEKAVPRSRSRCTAPLHLWPASHLISTRNRWQRRVARRSSCTT